MSAATAPDPSPPMNHVLVDFENVQPEELPEMQHHQVSFILLLGAKQAKLDVTLMEKLMATAASVQLIRLTSSGKNALDFALAYYLGRAVLADPTGRFYIVSKDKGYDPLMKHLRSRNIHAHRHDGFTSLNFSGPVKPHAALPKPPAVTVKKAVTPSKHPAAHPKQPAASPKQSAAPPKEPFTRVLEHLRTNNQPGKKKSLENLVKSKLGKNAAEEDAVKLMQQLQSGGYVTIDEKGSVTYQL